MPTQRDVSVWLGNSVPVEFAWPDGYEASSSAILTIWVGRELLLVVQAGAGLVVDASGLRFMWDVTIEQSRLIPLGKIANYEIEDRDGVETTVLYGRVIGLGGSNEDNATLVGDGSLNFSNPQNSGMQLLGW